MNVDEIDWSALANAALRVRRESYSPFSSFAVGAALLTEEGDVVVGCNVENRSYGLTICAERSAVATAIAEGQRGFVAIVIATGSTPPARPCGACLEVLTEFCAAEFPVMLVNSDGVSELFQLGDLLPRPFQFQAN